MFEIAKNQIIKLHKGDDSGVFPLLLNQGTKLAPIPYKVYPAFSILESPKELVISTNADLFFQKENKDGFHDFEYNYLFNEQGTKIGPLGWYLNKEKINLEDYGIIIEEGFPQVKDHIVIAQFVSYTTEVYLYIVENYASLDEWLIKKTFISSGETITEFADERIPTIWKEAKTVDKYNNMLLSFTSEDTQCLDPGEYLYQIKAKLYDLNEDEYILNTVTNRLPFYLVDGEDSTLW